MAIFCTIASIELTQMFEKIVPNKRNIRRGSIKHMSFLDSSTQIVVITNNVVNGINGLNASKIGLILPVLFLYDLQLQRRDLEGNIINIDKRSLLVHIVYDKWMTAQYSRYVQ